MAKMIHWKSKVTDAKGHGTTVLLDSDAEREVKRLNRIYPELHHWAEEA